MAHSTTCSSVLSKIMICTQKIVFGKSSNIDPNIDVAAEHSSFFTLVQFTGMGSSQLLLGTPYTWTCSLSIYGISTHVVYFADAKRIHHYWKCEYLNYFQHQGIRKSVEIKEKKILRICQKHEYILVFWVCRQSTTLTFLWPQTKLLKFGSWSSSMLLSISCNEFVSFEYIQVQTIIILLSVAIKTTILSGSATVWWHHF